MSVRNGFTIEIYGFAHSLLTFLACAAHSATVIEDLEDKRRWQARKQVKRHGDS